MFFVSMPGIQLIFDSSFRANMTNDCGKRNKEKEKKEKEQREKEWQDYIWETR